MANLRFLGIVVIGIFSHASGCSTGHHHPPGVYAAPAVVNLGTVNADDKGTIHGDFAIVNTSRYPVHIADTRLSCGCSRLWLSASTIAPNSSIEARLDADLEAQMGERTFEALLVTDSPAVGAVRLRLVAQVMTSELDGVILLNMGRWRPGATVDRVLHTLAGPVSAARVMDVRAHVDSAHRFEVSASANQDNVELVVKGIAPSRSGRFAIDVELAADGANWETAQVQLFGTVVPGISLPDPVFLGLVEPGDTADLTVELSGRPGMLKQASVTDVEVAPSNDLLRIVVVDPQPGRPAIRLTLRHPGEAGPFVQRLRMTLVVNGGETYQLSTSVRARFL